MIKAERNDQKHNGRTVFNMFCDACGKRIRDIELGAVVFEDFYNRSTDRYWICHKKVCFQQIENKHGASNWWELEWFIKDLVLSFNDLKTSDRSTTEGFSERFVIERKEVTHG